VVNAPSGEVTLGISPEAWDDANGARIRRKRQSSGVRVGSMMFSERGC
jgi:hypothetical protein